MDKDIKFWVAFHCIRGVGRVRFNALSGHFGTLEEAWRAEPGQLRQAGLEPKVVNQIVEAMARVDPDAEMERLERIGVTALTINDGAYPSGLKEIYDPPPVLYVRGALLDEDRSAVTVVGTRRVTPYGREVTRRLSGELARNGVTIVSGLARGVDSVAHDAALEAGGRTIAVQACGLDMVYPAGHTSLANRIVESGALISDYPLGTKPKPEHFPRRNRILAGLTAGTLVVEAPERSGALITARIANEEGREVFAVPGSILSPASLGVNRLIQDGAKPVLNFRDIIEELNPRFTVRQLPMPALALEDDTEAALLRQLSEEPTHVDELGRQSGLPTAAVNSALSMLELKGLVRHVGAMCYVALGTHPVDYPARVP